MTWMCGPVTKEVWSKAVILALLSIARLQKRDFAVIHFSGESNIKVEVFPKGQATAQETIACASHFFNGGTVFDEWMDEALNLAGQSAFDKADSICVSDGVGRLKPETLANWQKMRADRGMRSYSILIGGGEGEQLLWQISDAVLRSRRPGRRHPGARSDLRGCLNQTFCPGGTGTAYSVSCGGCSPTA